MEIRSPFRGKPRYQYEPAYKTHILFAKALTRSKAKLKADLSRMTRVRRVVSIKPTMGCVSCDATANSHVLAATGLGNLRSYFPTGTRNAATRATAPDT